MTGEQIDLVVEIARHLRDEAAQVLDARFDEALAQALTPSPQDRLAAISISAAPAGTCCTPTPSGQACCEAQVIDFESGRAMAEVFAFPVRRLASTPHATTHTPIPSRPHDI